MPESRCRRLTEHLYFIEDPHGARVPYCHCLYIQDERRTLIDSSCGPELVNAVAPLGVDLILSSHFHEDHTLNHDAFPGAEIWAHPLEKPGIESARGFQELCGFYQYGSAELAERCTDILHIKGNPVSRVFEDNEVINLGSTRVQVLHLPGHCAGHCGFYFPQHELVYTADLDLTAYGPWYGCPGSSVDAFIASIDRLAAMQPRIVVSAHAGVITEDIPDRFAQYKELIFQRDRILLDALTKKPQNLKELCTMYIFYPKRVFGELTDFFERNCQRIHLQRLINLGLVACDGDTYYLR